MKARVFATISLVFAFLLLSGCIENFPNYRASVKVQTQEETHDLLVIEDIKVTPSLVFTGTEFKVSFRIRHVGDPKTSAPVTIKELKAYDFGPCSGGGHVLDLLKDSNNIVIYPGEVKYFSLTLTAPERNEIAGLEAKCPIRIKVTYNYNATTQVEAYVMKKEKIEKLEKAGKSPYYTPKQNVGIGPVKIYFEFFQPQPFESGRKVVFLVYAKNLGDGDVNAPSGSKKLTITLTQFPSEANNPTCEKSDVKFFRGETNKIKCTWNVPKLEEEEKMYYLIGKMNYEYSVEKVKEVIVKPLPG